MWFGKLVKKKSKVSGSRFWCVGQYVGFGGEINLRLLFTEML